MAELALSELKAAKKKKKSEEYTMHGHKPNQFYFRTKKYLCL